MIELDTSNMRVTQKRHYRHVSFVTTIIAWLLFCIALSCNAQDTGKNALAISKGREDKHLTQFDSTTKTIHIFVALCDNKYQGIVPVPVKIGNGQDFNNNLYWGCGFGVRTYFIKSSEWKLVKTERIDSVILQRIILKHVTKNFYLVADAYNGKYIKQCTREFLKSSTGQFKDTLEVNKSKIGIAGNANLIVYLGHDGLMDFELTETFENSDKKIRDVIVLACYSKMFFSPHLKSANIRPILWTTGLMCPEAYTIHDAITGYLNNEKDDQIRTRAALAYAKYQKCSIKAARNLLVTGW